MTESDYSRLGDVLSEALQPVAPQHEPQLQRSESATKGDLHVAKVEHGACVTFLCPQELWRDG